MSRPSRSTSRRSTVTVDDADAAELHERAGQSAATAATFDIAIDHFQRALEIHRAAADRHAAARLTASLGATLLTARRYEEAKDILANGATGFADLADDSSLLRIRSQQARAFALNNEYDEAIRLADEVLKQAEPRDELLIVADTLITRGTALAATLRWREGIGALNVGRQLAEANGFSNEIFRAINNGISTRLLLDPRETFEAITDGIALARKLGQGGWADSFTGSFAFAGIRTGDWDVSVAELERALAGYSDARTRGVLVNNLANLLAMRGEPTADALAELEALRQLAPDAQTAVYFFETPRIHRAGGRPA